MTKIQINITREVLETSKMCGKNHHDCTKEKGIGSNCAISKAICSIFPNAWVYREYIDFKAFEENKINKNTHFQYDSSCTQLPLKASYFIDKFDELSPEERVKMEPISFEIEVPDQIIESIGISEVETILKDCPTMELIA